MEGVYKSSKWLFLDISPPISLEGYQQDPDEESNLIRIECNESTTSQIREFSREDIDNDIPHKLSQVEFSDLTRDLNVSKDKTEY